MGIFTLLVGAGVRYRRHSDEATLHFFWLCLAFFGAITFSFNGRLDRLDWFFYWTDVVSILLLPPLFLHFTLVFPERPRSWVRTPMGRTFLPLLYMPAALLGLARVVAIARSPLDAKYFIGVVAALDRFEPLYLSICLAAGLVILIRAFRHVRSVTARRQLRWIVWGTALGALPFALGYAVPYALGVEPSLPMELSAIPLSFVPLAFASAIVRYRLMDVEVILKRMLVWAVAIAAILGLYAVLLNVATEGFSGNGANPNWVIALLATAVVVLLASPVKNAIQAGLDRAFYRDRYDYRRALVGFARDLNADLDLNRLAERLVSRVMETLLVDRMVLFMADDGGDFTPLRVAGFAMTPPELARRSGLGGRLEAGHVVALDDPLAARRFSDDEIEFWRDWGLFYFVPCVANDGTIAILALGRRDSAEPLSSEDTALLAAVAGQVATALENGRLYSQLHVKAEELDRLREFSDNVLQSLDDGLVVSDPDGRILWWNRALEKLYGVPAASAVGRRLGDVFDTRFVEAVTGALRDSPDGATLSRIPLVSHRAPDDRLLLNVTIVPLRQHRDGELDVTGSVLILEDITARVELEKQLQVSEKMASIGLLAAGVAHEVNTPLTGIASFTQMLLEGADPADQRTKLLEKIERQTFRAAKIVNGLLHLSRQGGPNANDQGPVDLNAVISRRARPARAPAGDGQGQGAPRADQRQPGRRRRGAQAAAGVPEHVPQRARRHAARRLAVGHDPPRRRPGDRRGRRYRVRHSERAPGAHLRPVLHDQIDRAGHRPRPVDHLRHRPRARWHDARREPRRAGHALHPRVAALSQLRSGAGGVMSSSPKRRDPRHRRRRDHARDSRDPSDARRVLGAARHQRRRRSGAGAVAAV